METIRQLEVWWAYASRCAQLPASAPACDSFWTAAAFVAVSAVVFIALYILRQMVRNFLAVRADNMRVAEKARVADENTMAHYKADTDELFAVSPEEDVEQRIRQALDERKIGDQWGRPGASRKKEGPE